MDEETTALQGLWTVESVTLQGQSIDFSVTHWEFDGNRVQQIVPFFVDGGSWGTFTLDASTTPRHLTIAYPPGDADTDQTPRLYTYAYELSGDTLRIASASTPGYYPNAIDDRDAMITNLTRSSGPRPETKQASGITPRESPVFGTVTYNDNYNQWEAAFALSPDQTVIINLLGDDPDQMLPVGETLAAWTQAHEPEIRAYAATELIDLAEDWRDEDEEPTPLTLEAFADRITLQSLSVAPDGDTTFWYEDGDLFAGHVIVVSLNTNHEFTDAQIMG